MTFESSEPNRGEELRYPVGKFNWPQTVSESERRKMMEEIAAAPAALRASVEGLNRTQLETPYRPGGWTIKQVVHHLPDSHFNAYARFKLALTENEPVVKPYDQAKWAELPDSQTVSIEVSLALLEGMHERWLALLRAMNPADFKRGFRHPEYEGKLFPLEQVLALYAWHGRHHIGHITSLRLRNRW
jgi:hypothetical protein